ncbi:unnamed protein product, partial [marine sediment metagenome]
SAVLLRKDMVGPPIVTFENGSNPKMLNSRILVF